ncbi:MAG: hypothetical protein QXL85_07855 [Candidatus Bathyarchaeia archaeon]
MSLRREFLISILLRNPVKVSYITLLTLALLSQVFDLPEIIGGFIALPALVLLPILFGNALLYLIRKLLIRNSKNIFIEIGLIPSLIFEWFFGFFSIYALLFVLLHHTQSIVLAIVVTVAVCWVGAWRLDRREFFHSLTLVSKRSIFLFLTLIIIGLVPISIIKQYGTFPLPPSRAWTVGGYLYRFVYIVAEHGIPDTPYDIVHPPSLNILYGLISRMFSVDPLSLLWCVPFLLVTVLSLGIFLFTYELSRSKRLALIATTIGVWILSGTNAAEWPVAPEAAYVMYSLNPIIFYMFLKFAKTKQIKIQHILLSAALSLTFVAALKYFINITSDYTASSPYIVLYQILVLSYLLTMLSSLKISSSFAFPFTIGLTLVAIHAQYVGPFALLVATALFIAYRLNTVKKDGRSLVLALASQLSLITFTLLYIALQLLHVTEIPVYNTISSFLGLGKQYYPTFNWKFTQLIIGSSEFSLILFFLGMFFLLLSKSRQNLSMVTVTTFILLIYFLPEGSSYRVIDALLPFMAYVMALAVDRLANIAIRKHLRCNKLRFAVRINVQWLRRVIIMTLLATIVFSVAPKTINLFTKLGNVDLAPYGIDAGPTFPRNYEYEAALWIKKNTMPNTVIVSDPVNIEILSGLADRVPVAQISMGNPCREEDRTRLELIYRILTAEKDSEAYYLLGILKSMGITTEQYRRSFHSTGEESFIIVVSVRTSIWLDVKMNHPIIYYNECSMNMKYVSKFLNSNLFELLYKVEGKIYIFKPLL